VIDLGLLGPAEEPVRVIGARLRRRPVLMWTVAALVLALVAASGPPARPAVSVPVPVTGRFEVVGDLLFVATHHNQTVDEERIESSFDWTAHDLSTGEPLWTFSGRGEELQLVAADGLLWDGGMPLDPATGAWLSPEGSSVPDGYRYIGVPGGETLVVSGGYRPYNDSAVDAEFAYEVMGVDVRTGLVRWRDQPDPGVRVWLMGEPAKVVMISSDELVSLRDPDTGAVFASRRVDGATNAQLLGDQVLVWTWEAGQEVLHAYARGTMAELWELPEPTALEPCGQMLCRQVSHPIRLAYDRLTGQGWEIPSTTELRDPATGAPAWLTTYRLYPLADRFLGYDGQGSLRALLDGRTGRVLRDLTGWQAVVPSTVYGYDALPANAILETVTLVGPDANVARLDPATGELTDLGWLPARPVRCQPYSGGVVCLHADRIWVWPL
jgi:hypothetical protein